MRNTRFVHKGSQLRDQHSTLSNGNLKILFGAHNTLDYVLHRSLARRTLNFLLDLAVILRTEITFSKFLRTTTWCQDLQLIIFDSGTKRQWKTRYSWWHQPPKLNDASWSHKVWGSNAKSNIVRKSLHCAGKTAENQTARLTCKQCPGHNLYQYNMDFSLPVQESQGSDAWQQLPWQFCQLQYFPYRKCGQIAASGAPWFPQHHH